MPALPGTETDAIDLIARDMKSLVKKIQDLRHLGIEDSRIALPKICVIGDQSTGKSSLIEGMSEIKVPRSAGTCTRCPMEINLSEGEPGQTWACKIFLSRKYLFDGSRKITKLPKKSQPLGPWIEQDQEDEHFVTVTEREDIQEAIRWAQLAILNPGRASSDYIPGQNAGTDEFHCQVKFSPNVVRLDITAPNFPNLSFYDLPGVISQAEHDDERYLVSLVENLVKEYISHENCIVLLALPMTDDATNSSAARIMRDVRGAKARTLGVLTKPDRIQTGESYAQWVEILEGDKFALGHGYYVVRNNPDPAIEHSQAREEETVFFAGSPWATELAAYHDRFGTRRLQAALSNLLLEQIQGCLPRIIEQIDEKAARIDAELQTLPDPPSANVPYILCGKLNHLKDQIRAHIDGGSSQYPLQKVWGSIAKDFKLALFNTRPTVQLLANSDPMSFPMERDNADSDCEMTIVQRSVKRKTPGDRPTPAPQDTKPNQPSARKPTKYHTEHFNKFERAARMFTWEEIREINEDSYRAGIPDQTDPKAIEIMNQLSVEHWEEPMQVFLNATHQLVRDMLMKQLKNVFTQYYQTSLYRELKRIIEHYLQTLRKEHLRHAQENYSIEHNKPFTMATDTLELATNKAATFLQGRRHEARARCYLDRQGRLLQGDPRRENEIKRLTAAELGPDRFVQEVKMMATTRGYYEVASSRFVDSTCQSVHTKLFSKCREELITVIEKELRIFDDNALERCMELMAEDPERQRRRQYLLKEKEKITKAQDWLVTAKKEDDVEGPPETEPTVKSQPPEDWPSLANFEPVVG
ncbi:putative dynamin GTPase [Aspergillus clavatus NRRL 1]|uniref:Dynamin family protein n=1 Tax=Aspergillus clavatus (strain ATCC 1007 / CBS 513.65 / DSM 816 / NCTC 3887 / NRRL 1 / QM 1276 / 107) TaxID=344612 RepID=A1CT52_ASPCL|nr:Dynamin family protein [Aspergillus clavatus NRRL 1]EAW06489.1 Dynamin family protein [Aspergillus clavatus NRRL 1]